MKIFFVSFCAPRPFDRTFGNFVHHMAKACLEMGHQVDVLVPVRVFPNQDLFDSVTSPRNWLRLPEALSLWLNRWKGARETVEMEGVRYFYRRFSSLPATSKAGRNAEAFLGQGRSWLDKLVREEGYTHVVGHFLESLPLVKYLALRHGCHPAVYVHEDVEEYLKRVPASYVRSNLLVETDLFANSTRTVNQVRECLHHENNNVAFLGIDQLPLVPRRSKRGGRFKIGCVSRFHARKNQELLVNLAKLWKERNLSPVLRIDLVGDSGPYRTFLENLVEDYGVGDMVVFSDATDYHAIATHMAEADLFVFPSRFESFGLVLVEAAATGVPAVAAPDIGALQELRSLGLDVPVCDPDSAEGLAKLVEEIIANYEQYELHASRMREIVRKTFSWRGTTESVVSVISRSSNPGSSPDSFRAVGDRRMEYVQ